MRVQVWRDGQKRRVYVYRMLATGTIEEKVSGSCCCLCPLKLHSLVAPPLSLHHCISVARGLNILVGESPYDGTYGNLHTQAEPFDWLLCMLQVFQRQISKEGLQALVSTKSAGAGEGGGGGGGGGRGAAKNMMSAEELRELFSLQPDTLRWVRLS